MKRIALILTVCSIVGGFAFAQQTDTEAMIKALAPYSQMKLQVPGLTLEQYNAAVRLLSQTYSRPTAPPLVPSSSVSPPRYLGELSRNPYAPDSTSNPYGIYGSPYSPTSIRNPYSVYGSRYSPSGVANPYGFSAPKLFGQDGQYLGKLSANPYDPDSVSNPYGRFGSPYSPTSIRNPFSIYGSPYSSLSPTNPYATQAPIIVDDDE